MTTCTTLIPYTPPISPEEFIQAEAKANALLANGDLKKRVADEVRPILDGHLSLSYSRLPTEDPVRWPNDRLAFRPYGRRSEIRQVLKKLA
jgi:hypothetical protein